ncbi:MAG: alkyl hydroperoxide reductase [Candidatus Wallbacteria bacterium]|nr:alkyl hydroperoxide reductase [Candidatus Wallbacteria bacterium]
MIESEPRTGRSPWWMSASLATAGLYNLGWAAWIVSSPIASWELTKLRLPLAPELWRTAGTVIGLFGVALLLAARQPLRYWRIVVAGLAAKLAGVTGFAVLAMRGLAPWSLGWIVMVNDVIWWVPFGLILRTAFRDLSRSRTLL